MGAVAFNYRACGPRAGVLRDRADRIRVLTGQGSTLVIEVGKELLAAKAEIPHGQFGNWISVEFGWSEDTARRFMSVVRRFPENTQAASFDRTALYALAAGDVPDEAISEAVERSVSGEKITPKVAREIIDNCTAGQEQANEPPHRQENPQPVKSKPAAVAPEPKRPFADLPSLPPDVCDAFEGFKLCVLRHRLARWQEISQSEMVATLESLIDLSEHEPTD